MRSPVAASSCSRGLESYEPLASFVYSRVRPPASRRKSARERPSVYDWRSWNAIAAATSPNRITPARNSAGSWKRSERNTPALPELSARGRLASGRHLVADAPDGDDWRGFAELAAQLANVHVDRARVAGERVAPDALEQLVARQHQPAVVEQLPEQVELLRRELHFLVADAYLAATCVDDQIAVPDLGRRQILAVRRRPAQDGLHARDELTRIERLGEVIVRSHLEADDLVDVLVACSQHEDRYVACLTDAAADFDAVDVREIQVEHDQGGRIGHHLGERFAAGRRRPHGVARVLEVERDEGRDRRLVLHHQDHLTLPRIHHDQSARCGGRSTTRRDRSAPPGGR